MEIRHLQYFLAIAECGSVSRAAARLFVAQPSLSRQIHELERDIGAVLFTRTHRGVSLTAAGRQLLPRAQRAVLAFDLAAGTAHRTPAAPQPVLRVGVHGLQTRRVAAVLQSLLREQYPAVRVDGVTVTAAGVFDSAGRPRFHAVFARSGLLASRPDYSFEPLFTGWTVRGRRPAVIVVGVYTFMLAVDDGPPTHAVRDAAIRMVGAVLDTLPATTAGGPVRSPVAPADRRRKLHPSVRRRPPRRIVER